MTRVLVTGATGFVGRTLCGMLAEAGYTVRAALRTDRRLSTAETVVVGDIGSATEWASALEDVDCVMHLAAIAHVLHANADGYMETNARGTRGLAAAAVGHGVSKFVYLSSIKVNGEGARGRSYRISDEPEPGDAYARSKWLGERYLSELATPARMQATIVRSPLVYGPGVRANFLRLLRWVDAERVLPLGAVRNQRSLVSVWTLCDLLIHALGPGVAGNGTWLVSDGEDLSTPELVRRIAHAMGRRVRLLPVPVPLLRVAAALLGKGAEMGRLCDSLTVDIGATRAALAWSPPLSPEEALARTVDWYRQHERAS